MTFPRNVIRYRLALRVIRRRSHTRRRVILKEKNKHRLLNGVYFLVAGVGLEPHDLRVMSPTSYRTALPRDIMLSGALPPCSNIYYITPFCPCQYLLPIFLYDTLRHASHRRSFPFPCLFLFALLLDKMPLLRYNILNYL